METTSFTPFGSRSPVAIQNDVNFVARDVTIAAARCKDTEDNIARLTAELPPTTNEAIAYLNPICAVSSNNYLHTLFGTISAPANRLQEAVHVSQAREQHYTQRQARLTELRKELDESKNQVQVTWTKDEVSALLSKTHGYVPNSVFFEEHRDGYVSWRVAGLIMKPDNNHWANINGGKPVAIPLPEMTISVDFTNADVRITTENPIWDGFYEWPRDDDGDRMDASEVEELDYKRAHPHVLTNGDPCFGTFDSFVASAIGEADIQTVAIMLTAFLEQANSGDSAGKYWPRWIPEDVNLEDCPLAQMDMYSERGGYAIKSYVNVGTDESGKWVRLQNAAYARVNGETITSLEAILPLMKERHTTAFTYLEKSPPTFLNELPSNLYWWNTNEH